MYRIICHIILHFVAIALARHYIANVSAVDMVRKASPETELFLFFLFIILITNNYVIILGIDSAVCYCRDIFFGM